MRNDALQRHQKVHEKFKEEENSSTRSVHRSRERIESTSTISSEESLESSTLSNIDEEGLRKMLRKKNQEYEEKIQLGKVIYKILGQDNLKQESLDKIHKEALDLYIKQKQSIDQENIILRPWQGDLLRRIKKSRFGWERVVCAMDIKLKKSGICHVLGKRPLTTTDISI